MALLASATGAGPLVLVPLLLLLAALAGPLAVAVAAPGDASAGDVLPSACAWW